MIELIYDGSKWESVTVPTHCTLGQLRKALKSFPDDAMIHFSNDPKLAESETRIPVCIRRPDNGKSLDAKGI